MCMCFVCILVSECIVCAIKVWVETRKREKRADESDRGTLMGDSVHHQ